MSSSSTFWSEEISEIPDIPNLAQLLALARGETYEPSSSSSVNDHEDDDRGNSVEELIQQARGTSSSSYSHTTESQLDFNSSASLSSLEELARIARGEPSMRTSELEEKTREDVQKLRTYHVCYHCQTQFTIEDNLQNLKCKFHRGKFVTGSGWTCCNQVYSFNQGCTPTIHANTKKLRTDIELSSYTTFIGVPRDIIDHDLINYNPRLISKHTRPYAYEYLFKCVE
jgi:hypothetical protein